MNKSLVKTLIYLVLTLFALVWVFPFLTTFITILKSPEDFAELSFWQLPQLKNILSNLWFNFGYALQKAKIVRNLFNSLLYAGSAGVGSAFIAAMAAFSLVFLKLRKPQTWFISIFIGNLFPFQMFLIPLYIFLNLPLTGVYL